MIERIHGWPDANNFTIRLRVRDAQGESRSTNDWVLPTGRAPMLRDAKVTEDRPEVPEAVVVHAKPTKEPGCLSPRANQATVSQVVKNAVGGFPLRRRFETPRICTSAGA